MWYNLLERLLLVIMMIMMI